jgi:hypothetical protein
MVSLQPACIYHSQSSSWVSHSLALYSNQTSLWNPLASLTLTATHRTHCAHSAGMCVQCAHCPSRLRLVPGLGPRNTGTVSAHSGWTYVDGLGRLLDKVIVSCWDSRLATTSASLHSLLWIQPFIHPSTSLVDLCSNPMWSQPSTPQWDPLDNNVCLTRSYVTFLIIYWSIDSVRSTQFTPQEARVPQGLGLGRTPSDRVATVSDL